MIYKFFNFCIEKLKKTLYYWIFLISYGKYINIDNYLMLILWINSNHIYGTLICFYLSVIINGKGEY